MSSESNVIVLVPVSEELFLTSGRETYTAFPAGWEESGCDVFDVLNVRDDDFVGSFLVSPLEDSADAFKAWLATYRAV